MVGEYTIKVFTQLTRNAKKPTFVFTVGSEEQALVHIKQLFREGYRRAIGPNKIEWFPYHIIERVEAEGPGLTSGYIDSDVSA